EHEDCSIVETNKRYVCEKVLSGELRAGPQVPRVVCHREMAPGEVQGFFSEEGRTPMIEGFISKRGRPFTGLLFRKSTGKHGFEVPTREPKKKAKAGEEAEKPARKTAAKAAKTAGKSTKSSAKATKTAAKTTKTAAKTTKTTAKKA